MAGVIGLTHAGQYLDDVLFKNNPPYKLKIYKFINNFTSRCKNLHKCLDLNDKKFILETCVRKEYFKMVDNNFKEIVTDLEYRLLTNYVYTLTRDDFNPSTKTQKSLSNKKSALP